MRFSIILPIYNVEKFIERCIVSIVRQRYKDFELIAVNDGSQDSSIPIVRSILENSDIKFKIIDQVNGGLGSARNTGVKNAQGDYLVFVDSDDYVDFCLLETLSQAIDKNNPDLICYDYTVEYENGKQVVQKIWEENYDIFSINQHPEFLTLQPAAWNKCCSRELFLRTDCWYLENKMIYEDTAMSRALIASAEKIQYISVPLYYYVQRKSSIMHSSNSKIMNIINADSALIEWAKKKNLFERYYEEIQAIIAKNILFYAIDMIAMQTRNTEQQKNLIDFVLQNFSDIAACKYLSSDEKERTKCLITYQFGKYYRKYVVMHKVKAYIKGIIYR